MLNNSKLSAAIDAADLTDAQRIRLATYVSEAFFFDELLAGDLSALPNETPLLEVGSGIGLLSLLVAARGFPVTSVEPGAAGFGEMSLFRDVVLNAWEGQATGVEWVTETVQAVPETRMYGFAFAINVVEHVDEIDGFVDAVMSHVSPMGVFRFVCPNYHLPYEPHFNMPTAFSKPVTGRLMSRRINESDLLDPAGLWDELSWPTVHGIRKILRARQLPFLFSPDATVAYIDRALEDSDFAERKGPVLAYAGRALGLIPKSIYSQIPTTLLPLIDCRVRQISRMEVPRG